jgi:predicted nucleic acid-binding protein
VLFVDTSVLLYAISRDPAEQHKAKRANEILTGGDVALSVQVLQEFYVQATRQSRADRLGHEQAGKLVESFLRFPAAAITTSVMLAALARASALASLTGMRRSSKRPARSAAVSSFPRISATGRTTAECASRTRSAEAEAPHPPGRAWTTTQRPLGRSWGRLAP